MSVPGDGQPIDLNQAANREFSKARKGYDPAEVRAHLRRLTDELRRALDSEAALRVELDQAPASATSVEHLDPGAVTRALGDETVRIIDAARDAAVEIRSKAEEHAGRVVRDAHERANILTRNATELRERAELEAEDLVTAAAAEAKAVVTAASSEAAALRSEAEAESEVVRSSAATVLAERTELAEAEAERIRSTAAEDAADALRSSEDIRGQAEQFSESSRADALEAAEQVRERAEAEAAAAIDAAKQTGRAMIREAKQARERILRDLAERRQAGRQQLEALRAGRERLIEAFGAARVALDDASEEVVEALPAARSAASDAAGAVTGDIDAEVRELDRMIPPASEIDDLFESAGVGSGPDPAIVAQGPSAHSSRDTDYTTTEESESDEGDSPAFVESDIESASPPVIESEIESEAESEVESGLGLPAEPRDDGADGSDQHDPAASGGRLRLVTSHESGESVVAETSDRVSVLGVGVFDGDLGVDDDLDDEFDGFDDEGFDDDASPGAFGGGRGPGLTVVSSGGADGATVEDREARDGEHGVDELFARLRGAPLGGAAEGDADEAGDSAPDLEGDVAASMNGGVVIDLGVSDHQSLLDARDALLGGLANSLMRGLRRVVSDQENEVLDLVRRQRKWKTSDRFLAPVEDQLDRFRGTVTKDVVAIIEAGADFSSAGSGLGIEATAAAADEAFEAVAAMIIEPLRTKLAKVIDQSDDSSPDRTELVERLRAVYREVRNDRLVELAGDVATLGFNTGILRSAKVGDRLCWVVDNGGVACPDAEDNHLAGPIEAGADFPTGDRLPPAHPGCRCLLVSPSR